MMPSTLAESALGLIGTPFRLHGRHEDTGVDCVGLVALALERSGQSALMPTAYRLRQANIGTYLPFARLNGFDVVTGPAKCGDILLFALPAAQHHLAISLGKHRIVHAHAGLRRVVKSEVGADWGLLRIWRRAPLLKD